MTSSGRVRITRGLAVAVAGALLTASCAAGQRAQTADMESVQDGTRAEVGDMVLGGVAIHAPTSRSYPAGSTVQLAVTVVNNGDSADTLVNVSSPAFRGWGVVDNADATATSTNGGDTGLTIEPHSAQRLGLADLGAAAEYSTRTLVLRNLADTDAPLFSGTAVPVTFRFAKAGSTTVSVPVQLTAEPNSATLPAATGTPEE